MELTVLCDDVPPYAAIVRTFERIVPARKKYYRGIQKSAEVINMLTMEYNYADDVAAQREESLAEGMRLGEEKGRTEGQVETIRLMMGNMNLTFAQVMDVLKIQPPERDRLAALLS